MDKTIWDNLGNLESALANLENQNNLINLMENNYFNTATPNKLKLEWEYKTYQSLLFTIHNELINIKDVLKENIYELYENLK